MMPTFPQHRNLKQPGMQQQQTSNITHLLGGQTVNLYPQERQSAETTSGSKFAVKDLPNTYHRR